AMDFALMAKVAPFFVEAAWLTVRISFLALALGLILAGLGAAARLSRHPVPAAIGAVYVSVFRGTPALIQLFVLYFGGPQLGVNLDP
ncbi:ABC transporter permease subunit, partial [Acinetobacter baumannii]